MKVIFNIFMYGIVILCCFAFDHRPTMFIWLAFTAGIYCDPLYKLLKKNRRIMEKITTKQVHILTPEELTK